MPDEIVATGGDTSTAAPSAPSGAAVNPAGTPPSSDPAGAATSAAEKAYTYKEDRSNWVPSHVVRERTERAQQLERELYLERQRVAALSGVKPPTAPQDPETAAIRKQLEAMYPDLAELKAMREELARLKDIDPDAMKRAAQQPWVIHGSQVLSLLESKVKAAYGGADLTPKAMSRLQRLFVQEMESDPQLTARYERGDLSIIDEFVQDYTAGMLDPYRRSTTVAQQPRQDAARRLPRGGAGSAIAAGPARPTVKPTDGDAFHRAAFDAYQKS